MASFMGPYPSFYSARLADAFSKFVECLLSGTGFKAAHDRNRLEAVSGCVRIERRHYAPFGPCVDLPIAPERRHSPQLD